ncbi:hypothetical protein RU639_011977 [Aspergillus parasiticus]
MTSVINIGELVGSLTAAPLNDLAGRKGVVFIASIMVIVGVILQLATDHKYSMIIGGRILLGYGVGNFSATSPLYIGETAPTRIRGPLLVYWQLVLSIPQVIAGAINRGTQGIDTTVAYCVPMGRQLIFPLIVLAFLWWIPESLRWLLRKNKVDAARKSLQSINRDDTSYIADDDLVTLQHDIDNEKQLTEDSSWLDLTLDPMERRKTIHSAGVLVAQQVNGIQWFYYFGSLFSKAIALSDPFLMTLVVSSSKLSSCCWTIASEMAVGRNRNKIYAVAVACLWVTVWAIVFTLPYLSNSGSLGPKTGFVYTGLCVITFVYAYFCVGEVTGRSMEEINWFSINGISARKWRDLPFPPVGETSSEKSLEVNEKNSVNMRVEGP